MLLCASHCREGDSLRFVLSCRLWRLLRRRASRQTPSTAWSCCRRLASSPCQVLYHPCQSLAAISMHPAGCFIHLICACRELACMCLVARGCQLLQRVCILLSCRGRYHTVCTSDPAGKCAAAQPFRMQPGQCPELTYVCSCHSGSGFGQEEGTMHLRTTILPMVRNIRHPCLVNELIPDRHCIARNSELHCCLGHGMPAFALFDV